LQVGLKLINADKGLASLLIKDNGVGISKDDLEKIFDLSQGYTTPGTEDEKGTGLGLILCKEFIEYNNGEMLVESEKGKGTTVFMKLPAITDTH